MPLDTVRSNVPQSVDPVAAAGNWPAKFTFDEFWRFTEPLGGGLTANCLFMGQDLQVTTAMGITFGSKANQYTGLAMATALEWIYKLGHSNAGRVCTAADVARDYELVLGMEELGRKGPGHLNEWRAVTNCRLTVDGLKRAVRHKIVGNINDIKTRRGAKDLGDFDSFPADAQLCIASLSWANGNEFAHPEFCKACREENWFEAARECGLSAKENTVPRRQKAQEEMMHNAGCVKLGAARPDVLHWPTILALPTGPTGPSAPDRNVRSEDGERPVPVRGTG